MKLTLQIAAALVLVLLVLSATLLVYGSLEWFPTEEQQQKAGLVYGLAFGLLLLIEVLLVVGLRAVSRRRHQRTTLA